MLELTYVAVFGYFIFFIWSIIDVVKSEFKDPKQKLVWLLIITFFQPLGVFIYLSLAPNHRANKRTFLNQEKPINFRKE